MNHVNGEASAAAAELVTEIERVQMRAAKVLGLPTQTPPDPNKQVVRALIEAALTASEKGDDRKAVELLQLAVKAMT